MFLTCAFFFWVLYSQRRILGGEKKPKMYLHASCMHTIQCFCLEPQLPPPPCYKPYIYIIYYVYMDYIHLLDDAKMKEKRFLYIHPKTKKNLNSTAYIEKIHLICYEDSIMNIVIYTCVYIQKPFYNHIIIFLFFFFLQHLGIHRYIYFLTDNYAYEMRKT